MENEEGRGRRYYGSFAAKRNEMVKKNITLAKLIINNMIRFDFSVWHMLIGGEGKRKIKIGAKKGMVAVKRKRRRRFEKYAQRNSQGEKVTN